MASTPASIPAPKSANENSALRRDAAAVQVAEDDYQSFCEALGASARGRAFLAEYARRNRHADTEVVLEALNRLEETARTHKPAAEADRIRQDLRALLDTLRTAKPQTENSPSAIKAATLSALIDFTQARLEALVTMPDDLRALEALAAVPPPEQPELPIPQPLAATPAAPVVLMQPAAEAPKAEKAEALAGRLKSTVAPDAIGIPKVEFDYQAQLVTRPAASAQADAPVAETVAAWSELSPPPVAAPKAEAKVELKAEPQIEAQVEPQVEAQAEAKFEDAFETPFESWLAPAPADVAPAAAAIETAPDAMVAPAPTSAPVPAPQGKIEPGRVFKAGEVETYELWLDDLTVEVTETVVTETIAPEAVAAPDATTATPAAQPSITEAPAAADTQPPTAIAALVEQLQRPTPPGAAQPTIGRIEMPDPLAPILSLSEDERLALFT